MSKLRLFLLSFLLSAVAATTFFYLRRPKPVASELIELKEGVFVTSQLEPANFGYLRLRGVASVIDFRPDGEAKDQPNSEEMAKEAKNNRIRFHYIPIPHDEIPEEAVHKLEDTLLFQHGPVVLYCRTGRRAVRTFALAEADTPGGPTLEAILQMVRDAKFSADDLKPRLAALIARREAPTGAQK